MIATAADGAGAGPFFLSRHRLPRSQLLRWRSRQRSGAGYTAPSARACPGLDRSILIFMGLFWMLFEFGTIVANTVFGAFVNDVVPRPVLGRFYGLFRAISLIVGIFFMFSVFGKSDSHYVSIFIGIGLIYGLGFVAMFARVKEGDYPPPPVDDDGPPRR